MKITSLFCIPVIIFTSACSTKGQRTEKYPPKSYDYSPEEQSLIRRGEIAVGFDESQVRMAWGNPSRIRTDSVSNRYYWEYQQLETRQNVFKQIGNTIARGSDPSIVVRQDPFYDKLSKRVVFDISTRKVSSFRTFF